MVLHVASMSPHCALCCSTRQPDCGRSPLVTHKGPVCNGDKNISGCRHWCWALRTASQPQSQYHDRPLRTPFWQTLSPFPHDSACPPLCTLLHSCPTIPAFVRLLALNNVEECRLLGFLRSMRRLLLTANVVPTSPIIVTLMMEALRSSETSVLTRATLLNIPENCIVHSNRRENLKSYIALTGWAL
jgi:hypothetical protein